MTIKFIQYNGIILIDKFYYGLMIGMRKQFPRISFYADETDFAEVKSALKENKNIISREKLCV